MKTITWICLALAAFVGLAAAAELAIGPGKQFDRIEPALARAKPGDTILVFPPGEGQAYEKVALYVATPKLTIKAKTARAGDRIILSGKGFDYSGRGHIPRAIVQFSPGADGCTLEGFELAAAHNESHNGAGVRINQANDVTIRRCEIHGNDMGIMSNGDGTEKTAVNQRIENCLIHSNGDRSEPGYNHNLYLGGTSVTVEACEVHSSLTGHNIKSRARLTRVLWCYVHDSANRELDLVDARDTTAEHSDAVVAGCVIVKGGKMRKPRGDPFRQGRQERARRHDLPDSQHHRHALYLAAADALGRQGVCGDAEQRHLGLGRQSTRPKARRGQGGAAGGGPATGSRQASADLNWRSSD